MAIQDSVGVRSGGSVRALALVGPTSAGKTALMEALLEAATRNRKYMRGLLAAKLNMRFTPELRFRIDTALDYAGKIEELLKSPAVQRDLKHED